MRPLWLLTPLVGHRNFVFGHQPYYASSQYRQKAVTKPLAAGTGSSTVVVESKVVLEVCSFLFLVASPSHPSLIGIDVGNRKADYLY